MLRDIPFGCPFLFSFYDPLTFSPIKAKNKSTPMRCQV
ncbi:hypothetical protein KIS4809_0899 [Bacillus sp. ZZV12-4809]|nr:hypothetical protein KIS4809_0899 [Bacillus sp. ZZV12-4809]